MTTASCPAVDVLMAAFLALSPEEQSAWHRRAGDVLVERRAAADSLFAEALRSLRTVTEQLGHSPTVDEYRTQYRRLQEEGIAIVPAHRVVAAFDGSWAAAARRST